MLGVYPQGVLPVFKVTLKDGRSTLCNDEHLWSYFNQHGDKLLTASLKSIQARGLINNSGSYKIKIPRNKPIEYPFKALPVDPYVLGCFLGDGYCVSGPLAFSSTDEELVATISQRIGAKNYVRKNPQEYTWFFERQEPKGKITRYIQTEEIFGSIRKYIMQYSENKSIPPDYLISSIEQRYELLRGLLDTDGCINSNDKYHQIRFTTISDMLCKNISQLLWSLGYWNSTVIDNRTNKYSTGKCYSLTLSLPNIDKSLCFKLKRKKDIALKATQQLTQTRYDWVPIINIEELHYSTEMICIQVDNPEQLYLTNDYIVTHNTTLIKHIIEALGVDPEADVRYVSYTGKGASVLKNRGCPNATTAHKLIYYSKQLPNGRFVYTKRSTLEGEPKIVVVDEVSMLPKKMWDALCRYKIYIIACGDPAQLSPIPNKKGEDPDNHVLDNPHIFLDEVMRQAQESEIIRLSMFIRNGKPLYQYKPEGQEVRFLPANEINNGVCSWADEILCATHSTRRILNRLCRAELGYGEIPEIGDKLINLNNDWDVSSSSGNPFTNGVISKLQDYVIGEKVYPPFSCGNNSEAIVVPTFQCNLIGDDEEVFQGVIADYNEILTEAPALTAENEYWIKKKLEENPPHHLNYGYAISVWKAQGSEWDKVLLFDEPHWPRGKEERQRYLYTGITRAVSRLVVAL